MWRLGLLFLLVSPVQAQQELLRQASELERQGQYAAAVDIYRAVLAQRSGDVGALLGLERTLRPLNRSGEMLTYIRTGLAANPNSPSLYAIALRVWADEGEQDSVRVMAERWAEAVPGDESPYREWGEAAIIMNDRVGAKAAYRLGRERLGAPDALAAELAQLALSDRDYNTALQEWVLALQKMPEYQETAADGLARAPSALRPGLLEQLGKDGTLAARRLDADLRTRWGDPIAGFQILERALPADRNQAADVLRGFVDQVKLIRTPDARRVEGQALEALAARSSEPQASQLRLDAAEAYADGGDRAAARRMLAGLADDRNVSGLVAAEAGGTLVAVLIAEQKLAEAAQRLDNIRLMLPVDRYEHLQQLLALGWAKTGALAKAEATIASDSSVEGLATRGWIRLYRGDVAGALEWFKAAGPFAGERTEATERTTLLALLQPIEADSIPELGRGFLALSQADTSGALRAFEKAAAGLQPGQGGAGVRLYAGQVALAARKFADAERLFRAAAVAEAPGTAPAAELVLGELLIAQRRPAEAVQVLEHLILSYPESALVAQARRRLDEARSAIPKT